MTRTTVRRLLAAFALTTAVASAPAASANPLGIQTATFLGGFDSACTLPTEPLTGGPAEGPYTCFHSASSTACFYAVNADPAAVVQLDTCTGDLLSGWTEGSAGATPAGWTCANGAGAGRFLYVADDGGSFEFDVSLDVTDGAILVTGSYFDFSTGQAITVRATFPAECAWNTTSPIGYQGTITPF